MSTDFPQLDKEQQLAAFADGELDGAQNLEVLKRLKEDPATAGRVEDQQKLRQAVAAAMDGPEYKAPAALRDQLMQLAKSTPAESDSPSETTIATQVSDTTDRAGGPPDSPVLAVIGRWIPAAVAAILLIGALVVFNQNNNRYRLGDTPNLINASNVLNASIVDQFGDRHFKCARHMAKMHGVDKLPQNLTELPGALSEYFHEPINPEVLDFSELGYEFDVAGLCLIPGKGAVHVVYQSKASTGQTDSLSLWMRPYEEGTSIEPDKLYASKATEETYPMVVWHHGDMVYYLVGDNHETVERAFDLIRSSQQ